MVPHRRVKLLRRRSMVARRTDVTKRLQMWEDRRGERDREEEAASGSTSDLTVLGARKRVSSVGLAQPLVNSCRQRTALSFLPTKKPRGGCSAIGSNLEDKIPIAARSLPIRGYWPCAPCNPTPRPSLPFNLQLRPHWSACNSHSRLDNNTRTGARPLDSFCATPATCRKQSKLGEGSYTVDHAR